MKILLALFALFALFALIPLAALHAQTDGVIGGTLQVGNVVAYGSVTISADLGDSGAVFNAGTFSVGNGGFTHSRIVLPGVLGGSAALGTAIVSGGTLNVGGTGGTVSVGGSGVNSAADFLTVSPAATTVIGNFRELLPPITLGNATVGGSLTLNGPGDSGGIINRLTITPGATTTIGGTIATTIAGPAGINDVDFRTIGVNPVVTLGAGSVFGIDPVFAAGNLGSIFLTPGVIHANPGLTLNGGFLGTSLIVTGRTTFNIYSSQTLASLTIADGVEVTFGDGLPFTPASASLSAAPPSDFIPEPGSAALLAFGACALLGQRRRTA